MKLARIAGVIGAVAALATLALGGTAQAACTTSPTGTTSSGGVTSYTVNFSSAIAGQCWHVPESVVSAQFDVYGAAGGDAGSAHGGKGAHLRARLPVTPDTNINVTVGDAGASGGDGGKGGSTGGDGGGNNDTASGGGGGSSDVRKEGRVLVAGGGGGAGGDGLCDSPTAGGDGGNAGTTLGTPPVLGVDGAAAPANALLPGLTGGLGGLASGPGGSGGTGGTDGSGPAPGSAGEAGIAASATSGAGDGGDGGPQPAAGKGGYGGGGGGGYSGGGGGGSGTQAPEAGDPTGTEYCTGGGGGAGGASFWAPEATDVLLEPVDPAGDHVAPSGGKGKVYITYIPQPAPDVTTGQATAIAPTTATVTGTIDTQQLDGTYYFEYGTTTDYGTTTPIADVKGSAYPSQIAGTLVNLEPSTTYHYRLSAWTAALDKTKVIPGADATFTTSPAPTGGGDGKGGDGGGGKDGGGTVAHGTPYATISAGLRPRSLTGWILDGRGSRVRGGRIAHYRWTVGGKVRSHAGRFGLRVTRRTVVSLTVTDDRGHRASARVVVRPRRKLTVTIRSAFCAGCTALDRHATAALRRLRADVRGARAMLIRASDDSGSRSHAAIRRTVRIARAARALLLKRLRPRPKRALIRGAGGAHPIAPNRTDRGRARNRRLTITLLGRNPAPRRGKHKAPATKRPKHRSATRAVPHRKAGPHPRRAATAPPRHRRR